MNFTESFRIALDGLLTNRLRSSLTMLGIIIGVGAVIGLVSLGRGVENFVASEFQSLGSNVLFVYASAPVSNTRTTIQPISTIEGAALANPIIAPNIARVAMQYDLLGTISYGGRSTQLGISAVTPNFPDVRAWYVRNDGTFITQTDIDDASRVVVLGTTTVERLFGDKTLDPIGQQVRINERMFTVIGVMDEKASSFFGDENLVAFIPLSTGQTRMAQARTRDGGYEVSLLHIQARSEDAMSRAMLEIETYLSDAHNITFQGEQDFTIINQGDLLNSLGQVTGILTIFLGLIAGISLLVGGIGIMNIMLVSVTERTREIGLRKAVGANGKDILLQFLIESLLLSIVGGALGVAFGAALAYLGSVLVPDLEMEITADAILLATVVSSFIGIFFGLYPANRAAQMRPIDALRFE